MSEESDKELLEEDYATSEHIHVAAYFKWQHRGCGHGESLNDWVSAHKEIVQAGR
jgi:hypothetical protein